jgi:hypothetical protein
LGAVEFAWKGTLFAGISGGVRYFCRSWSFFNSSSNVITATSLQELRKTSKLRRFRHFTLCAGADFNHFGGVNKMDFNCIARLASNW